ncbi:MAG: hypothetical protein JO128_02050, partial [Alphaproteobacteria bacterium]|nr:hypothetical protein [Alphaproteobacteria bacterium]
MTSPQDLKQAEADSLSKLEASYQQLNTQAVQFSQEHAARRNQIMILYQQLALAGASTMAAITAAEETALSLLHGYCEHMGKWQSYLLSFEPAARTLGAAGLPRLSVRLHEIGSDLAGALDTYRAMCASMLQHREAIARASHETVNRLGRTIQDVVGAQRQAFETFQSRWSNEAYNKCPVCGS